MHRDLRDIIKSDQDYQPKLAQEHRKRFEKKLAELHARKKRDSYFFMKVAASFLIFLTVGYFILNNQDINYKKESLEFFYTDLGSISPEMQKIENYYTAAINYELASLNLTDENKKLIDSYLDKIGKLDKDYKRLQKELAKKGINNKTINALITNLQLRLQLLLQLKNQIQELQTTIKHVTHEDVAI